MGFPAIQLWLKNPTNNSVGQEINNQQSTINIL